MSRLCASLSASAVHPRTCGANGDDLRITKDKLRFIPAHAGLMSSRHEKGIDKAVHPRTCGANSVEADAAINAARFIPAHAGLMDAGEWGINP